VFIKDRLSAAESDLIKSIGIVINGDDHSYEQLIGIEGSIMDSIVSAMNRSKDHKRIPEDLSDLSDCIFKMISEEQYLQKLPYLYKRPAVVKFIGRPEEYDISQRNDLIRGHFYLAYFVEYWETERNNVHIKNERGKIDYWYKLNDFEIIEDKDGALSLDSAVVRCIDPSYSPKNINIVDPEYGEVCEAVAISRDGYYLIHSGSHNYYYPRKDFEIIEDPKGILDPHKRNYFLNYGI